MKVNISFISLFRYFLGLILHFLVLMPCFALHLNLTPILLALGQPEAVVEYEKAF